MDLKKLTIKKAHDSLVKGEYSARDLAEEYLKVAKEKNPEINAYLEIYDDVLAQADEADRRIKNGNADILTGIPFAIKDNILIEGRTASAASKILENYVATYDATAIKKLKEKGVVFLGRVNMDEFAMGGSTENSAFGVTKNPHDLNRVSGGSSGGSAAVVAMGGALVSLGSDTGGSIRQPASFCGVVGLKPTYGSVSRSGLMAMGSSLDVIGPIGKTVEDAEIIFNAIKGIDPLDSTTSEKSENFRELKKKIGVPYGFINQGGIEKSVLDNFNASVEKFKSLGYEIVDLTLPHNAYALSAYYIIMPAEVSSNMARFDGVKFGSLKEGGNLLEDYLETRGTYLGNEVRRRIMLGTYVLSTGYYDAYYHKANLVRDQIKNDFERAFKEVDVILTPTAPSPAFKIGEKSSDPMQMYLEDIFTITQNLVGIPAISIPSGMTEIDGKNLPLSIQLSAPHHEERTLFEIGKGFESLNS